MITMVLFVVGVLTVAGYIVRHEGLPDEGMSRVLCAELLLIGMGLGGVLGGAAATVIGAQLPAQIDKEPSHQAELVALRSSDGIDGSFRSSFFIGVGHIGTEQFYFWYERGGSGGGVTPRQQRRRHRGVLHAAAVRLRCQRRR